MISLSYIWWRIFHPMLIIIIKLHNSYYMVILLCVEIVFFFFVMAESLVVIIQSNQNIWNQFFLMNVHTSILVSSLLKFLCFSKKFFLSFPKFFSWKDWFSSWIEDSIYDIEAHQFGVCCLCECFQFHVLF